MSRAMKLLRHLWRTLMNPPKKLQPGQPAPHFETRDHLGRKVSSEDLAGKRYVLWFYPKADTPG